MKLEKFERVLAGMCVICVLSFVGQYVINSNRDKIITVRDDEELGTVCVEVLGEVTKPGKYRVKENSRVCEAIYDAGGITQSADVEDMDLTAIVTDGLKITVPAAETAVDYDDLSVNINTADKAVLCLLPGVGEVLAERIIEYRENNGGFAAPEDIMRVKGVGEKNFEKMKDYIRTEELPK